MTPATSHPLSLPRLTSEKVVAGDILLNSKNLDLCKSTLPVFSPVMVSVPVVTSPAMVTPSANCDVLLQASTCDSTGSNFTSTVSQAQPESLCPPPQPSSLCPPLPQLSVLCPLAAPFVLEQPPLLYPAGKDRLGRDITTEETAIMNLEYNDAGPDAQDDVPPANPDIEDVRGLRAWAVKLPDCQEFTDRVLPPSSSDVCRNQQYPPEYFLDLHEKVRLVGTYNFAGARVPLSHSKLRVDKFRELLKDYDDIGILQLIQFGFPVGLAQEFDIKSCTQNHSSSYEYFSYLDEFVMKEISLTGMTGPFSSPPFKATMVSPLMTAVKKPGSRRPVFDGTYGDLSINNNTPEKEYLGEACDFSFPTVLDLANLILKLGPGCLLYKRDLSRWFMQLPLDPGDYDKLGVVWRGSWFLFISYVWGCRHAGYNAQRVSRAVLHIHKLLSLGKYDEAYNAVVYMDDFAGAEHGNKAWEAFDDLGVLLEDLGVTESKKKALPPSTKMLFLGVEFDTIKMCMQVGEAKRTEVKSTISKWYRRTVATKQELQSLQGQLMWISKVVRFSRCFVTRIIAEQKSLKAQKQKTTLSKDIKKDLLWWKLFLDVFNGVELLVPPTVACNVLGDATLSGGGAWDEANGLFWSRKFPFLMQSPDIRIHLKEFITLIISVRLWGHKWTGKRVALHCDNVAVVETINCQKPKDPQMQQCLREFLFHVATLKFEPVMVWIPTDDNFMADFISRNHNEADIKQKFEENGVTEMSCVTVPDELFNFTADW